MTTEKFKYTPHITHHPLNEGTSYIPVNLLKTQEILVEKSNHESLKAQDYKIYH